MSERPSALGERMERTSAPAVEMRGAPADQQAHQQGTLFARFHIKLDAIGNEVTHQAAVEVRRSCFDAAIIGGGGHNFCAALTFLDGGRFDAVTANFFEEVGVAQIARSRTGAVVKLFEYGEKHHANHQPYGNLGKPGVVQEELPSKRLIGLHSRLLKAQNI